MSSHDLKRKVASVAAYIRSADGAIRGRDRFAALETYCMFIGYPRSGHSLVGSLLDAHPEAVIAHELDALRFMSRGFRRNQVLALILDKDARFTAQGRVQDKTNYDYSVPGQWQGKWETLRVIGDKKGRSSTRQIHADPQVLDKVRTFMKVPVRFVHVIRNPFDNIATWTNRNEVSLDEATRLYQELVETNAETRVRLGPDVLDIHHEQLLVDPKPHLTALVEHVGLKVPDGYLEDCAAVLYPEPRRTRQSVEWTPAQRTRVEALIESTDFLHSYTFDL